MIEDLPRLADFCTFAQAAEPGLGIKEGSVVAAYRENRADTVTETLSCPLAQSILGLEKDFVGTAKELAVALGKKEGDYAALKLLGGELRDLVTSLECRDVKIAFKRSHGKKVIQILKIKKDSPVSDGLGGGPVLGGAAAPSTDAAPDAPTPTNEWDKTWAILLVQLGSNPILDVPDWTD